MSLFLQNKNLKIKICTCLLILFCAMVIFCLARNSPAKEKSKLGMQLPFQNVALLHDPALFCNFHLGIQVMDVSSEKEMSTILYRYEAKPIFPTGPIAVRPDVSCFYICTENELLEFDKSIRLMRRIPISAFDFGHDDYVFSGTLRASNDSLWMTVRRKQKTGDSLLETEGFIVQWYPDKPVSSRIKGPYVSSSWAVDPDSGKIFIIKPKALIYDFATQANIPQSWGDYSYIDYDKQRGILLSNRPGEKNDLIVRVDLGTDSQIMIGKGSWAKWGPSDYIYFVRGKGQLWRCLYDGSDLRSVYLASKSIKSQKGFLPAFVFSADKKFLAFFYYFPSYLDAAKRGIVLMDLDGGKYRELSNVGFRSMAWINQKDLFSSSSAETIEYNLPLAKKAIPFIELNDAVFFWGAATIESMLRKGADVNIIDSLGNMPIHYAAELGREDVLRILIANGAHVNAKNENGMTPLHKAVEGLIYKHRKTTLFSENRVASVKVLLEAGADIEDKNEFGQTPLDIAKRKDLKNIIPLLEGTRPKP